MGKYTLNRRQFLKSLGVVAASVAIPDIAFNVHTKFDPKQDYGCAYEVTDDSREFLEAVRRELDEEIAEIIPRQYRHRIRYKYTPPNKHSGDPLGLLGMVAWQYIPT